MVIVFQGIEVSIPSLRLALPTKVIGFESHITRKAVPLLSGFQIFH